MMGKFFKIVGVILLTFSLQACKLQAPEQEQEAEVDTGPECAAVTAAISQLGNDVGSCQTDSDCQFTTYDSNGGLVTIPDSDMTSGVAVACGDSRPTVVNGTLFAVEKADFDSLLAAQKTACSSQAICASIRIIRGPLAPGGLPGCVQNQCSEGRVAIGID